MALMEGDRYRIGQLARLSGLSVKTMLLLAAARRHQRLAAGCDDDAGVALDDRRATCAARRVRAVAAPSGRRIVGQMAYPCSFHATG